MPLSEAEQAVIEKMTMKLDAALVEVRKWKVAINGVCEAVGEPAPYSLDSDGLGGSPAVSRRPYARDEFFNKQLTPVVRQILTDFGALDEHELYSKMIEGGYKFDETNPDKAKTGLKISLGKLATFGRTPKGHYTIISNPRPRKAAGAKNGDAQTETAESSDAAPGSGTEEALQ